MFKILFAIFVPGPAVIGGIAGGQQEGSQYGKTSDRQQGLWGHEGEQKYSA